MKLVRKYKNSSSDVLRIDTIHLENRGNTLVSKADTHTYKRRLHIEKIYDSGVSSRVVASIEVAGDFSEIDTSHFRWAKWNSPVATLDMSDLPIITGTV